MSSPVGFVDTAVQEVKAQADKLGVAWQLRAGAVLAGSDPSLVLLRLDGDTTPNAMPVQTVSLIGPLAVGARVYVLDIPPAGQYVVGVGPRQWSGLFRARARRETNSTTTTTEVGVLRLDSIPLMLGRTYLLYTGTVLGDSSVANDAVNTLLRIDTTGAAATTASTAAHQCPDVQVNAASPVNLALMVSHTPAAANEILSVLLSVSRAVGSGSVGLIAGATFPIELFVEDKGPDVRDTGVDI